MGSDGSRRSIEQIAQGISDMKPISKNHPATLLAVVTLFGATASTGFAQGNILFDTHVEGFVDAPMYGPHGLTLMTGTNDFAQLYVGANAGSLFPVGSPVNFGTGAEAGYLSSGEVVVPYFPAFSQVFARISFWREGDLYGVVGHTELIPVTLAESGTASNIQYATGKLQGLSPAQFPTLLRPVSVSLLIADNSVVLDWFDQGLGAPTVFVPEEADNPAGPWRDITEGGGPWITESGGRYTPPKPLILPKPDETRFYRIRLTTNTGP
jgi:hypothetical protein